MSLCPPEGRPVIPCPEGCGTEVGVVRVDVGTPNERELLVDLDPYDIVLKQGVRVWAELFSGHPPTGIVLPAGSLHLTHCCPKENG